VWNAGAKGKMVMLFPGRVNPQAVWSGAGWRLRISNLRFRKMWFALMNVKVTYSWLIYFSRIIRSKLLANVSNKTCLKMTGPLSETLV
jgi:hypothetical protein